MPKFAKFVAMPLVNLRSYAYVMKQADKEVAQGVLVVSECLTELIPIQNDNLWASLYTAILIIQVGSWFKVITTSGLYSYNLSLVVWV